MGSGKIIEKSGIKTIAEAKAARAAKQAEIIEKTYKSREMLGKWGFEEFNMLQSQPQFSESLVEARHGKGFEGMLKRYFG